MSARVGLVLHVGDVAVERGEVLLAERRRRSVEQRLVFFLERLHRLGHVVLLEHAQDLRVFFLRDLL